MKTFNLNLISRQGFSLLEILIAITLLAFITLGVVNITDNAVVTMERTSDINKNNLQIETALSRLEWDFSQIYSPLYFSKPFTFAQNNTTTNRESNNFSSNSNISQEYSNHLELLRNRFDQNQHFSGISSEGLPIPRFHSPEKDVFEFFTSSNRRKFENSKQSHFAWVKYALVNQESDDRIEKKENNIPPSLKSFVRYFYSDDPYFEERLDSQGDKIKGAVLLKNVESLEFQFWNPANKKWENSLRNIEQGEGLLRGLKLFITWYDDSGNKRKLEKIFRTLWPMVVPKDYPLATVPNTGSPQRNDTNNNNTNGMESSDN